MSVTPLPGNTYSYSLFAFDTSNNYAAAATATVAVPPPGPVHECGTITADTTWSPQRASVYILDCTVDVPAGVTLTLAPGTIVKAFGSGSCGQGVVNCSLSVEGSLQALGIAGSPVTFTSWKDTSIGGDTDPGGSGDGSPQPGDWGEIWVGGGSSLDLEYANVSYATDGVDSTTDAKVIIGTASTPNTFTNNSTALYIAAVASIPGVRSGTNAAIHGNWFDGNGRALDGSADWLPGSTAPVPTPCGYDPTMYADGNTYGSSKNPTPFVSLADYAAIQLAIVGGGHAIPG